MVDDDRDLLDIDRLADDDPFEIDDQAAHLFKHATMGIDDIHEVWRSEPVFYAPKPPADRPMVAKVGGRVLVVPIARPDSGDPTTCRPSAATRRPAGLAQRYREDR